MLVVWISALFLGSSPAEFDPVFLVYINTFNICSAPLSSTSPPWGFAATLWERLLRSWVQFGPTQWRERTDWRYLGTAVMNTSLIGLVIFIVARGRRGTACCRYIDWYTPSCLVIGTILILFIFTKWRNSKRSNIVFRKSVDIFTMLRSAQEQIQTTDIKFRTS